MANKIKIGNLEISAFKLGALDCKIYLGDIKLYPQDEPHDYSQDYLTLRVTESGTIVWKAAGSGAAKEISYSVDNGQTWSSITSTSAGVTINVSAGDVVLIKGSNTRYCEANKNNYSAFSGGTAKYDAEGNMMSLIYGDNFTGQTTLTTAWALSNVFNHSNVVSAENLVMPATTLTSDCYRATFANCPYLTIAPQLPATTMVSECYYYMFDNCVSLVEAPKLLAPTLATKCYLGMFHGCSSLNYIKCLATNPTTAICSSWVDGVAATGTFVKASGTTWTTGVNGIPTGWIVKDEGAIEEPVISFDGVDTITLTCATVGASIYYKLDNAATYTLYDNPIVITADTTIEAYSENEGYTSTTVSQRCIYVPNNPFEYSNRSLDTWTYNSSEIEVPYSVNAIDGHSASYAKGEFNFNTSFGLREAQPTYLWFEHADQSADIYINNTKVETHWGGYNAFFSDVSSAVTSGTNQVRVVLNNTKRNTLAPCAGDFNFNATLGYVKLFTSPYIPDKEYGYDGFHVTSDVSSTAATINVKTNIPTGATVVCKIDSGETNVYSATSASTGAEMVFTTTIANPHLWDGTIDPFMYKITLEIYDGEDLYHKYERPYGLRYYEYLINDTTKYGTVGSPFTGFKLNGHDYQLRGVCMHNDLVDKANAMTEEDIENDFDIIQELGCNFLRLAHYPHPKKVYDMCDELGIIVQTEVPWVNNAQSSQPADYYNHLTLQYQDMVNQHYNHPSIMFWGLANEITTDSAATIKTKINDYVSTIKALDSERLVGFVVSHSINDPVSYFSNPNVDWYGCNTYVGWYIDRNTNDPTSQLNTRVANVITNNSKAMALSEYGAGGTQHCHSDDFLNTTTRGNNPRHDIEYQMWLHEGHIAAIKNFPQLLFSAQWQLFDIAVASRSEGYTICLDGVNTSTDSSLKRLNDKGIVERDHVTKKDTFYLYKAEWSSENFVHICGKDYTKRIDRAIKCYTNDATTLSLKVNGTLVSTATVTNHIAVFSARTFDQFDVVTVEADNTSDSFTFGADPITGVVATFNVTTTGTPTPISYKDGVVDGTSGFSAIEIDGVVQQTVESAYTFSELGEHTVKYQLVDPTTIDVYAFANCTDMINVKIPTHVTTISENAFLNCDGLSHIDIPNGVITIDDSAFSDCDGLTRIVLPNSVTTIGDNAFKGCDSLTCCTIGNGVTTIGHNAFSGCSNLDVFVSKTVSAPSIQSDTFKGVHVDGTLFSPTNATGYDVWMGNGDYYLGKYNWIDSDITSGTYPPSTMPSGATLLYGDVEGYPMVSTDASGNVTSFEYVDASLENPVGFDGSNEMDTQFLPFKDAKDFEIIFHCKAKQEEQTYRGTVDGVNWDNLANILEFKLERTNYEGVGLRFARHTADNLILNYRKAGAGSSTNYQLAPRSDEHTDEWNFRIVYQNNTFTMYDRYTNEIVRSTSGTQINFTNQTFGDINDLTLTVGAAYDHNSGTFFRFGRCDVYEFMIRKL